MLRGEHRDAAALVRFARGGGMYRLQGRGHANLYQLFLERALTLLAPAAASGSSSPPAWRSITGLRLCAAASSTGAQSIRSSASRTATRSFQFTAVCAFSWSPRRAANRAARSRAASASAIRVLDRIPDGGAPRDAFPVTLTTHLIARLSGDQLVIPEIRSPIDLAIAEKAAAAPPLGSDTGWGARFGRELNATDDAEVFRPPRQGLPIIEGKQLTPFAVNPRAARFSIRTSDVRARLRNEPFSRARLAYRDVASAGNRLSLIAAIVPSGCVTTHTVFCLKDARPIKDQRVLCALLNSYVANFLVRQRIGTHLSTAIVEQLPVPRPERGSIAYEDLARLSTHLEMDPEDRDAAAATHARAARLYGLDTDELCHVLDTFPLVPRDRRAAVLSAWARI